MTPDATRRRPRPAAWWSGAFFVRTLPALAVMAAAAATLAGTPATPVHAQVPDTVPPPRADTIPAPQDAPVPDTIPPDTVPEEPPDPATLPPMTPVGTTGWTDGVWEWNRQDLLRFPDLSLLHLLERIPGITPVRIASIGQAEGVSLFGTTAAGIRYEIDGFGLDPLTAPTFDPAQLPLLALESVRVERRMTGATVRLRTLSPTDPRPLSVIEAGTGDLRTNLFRGTFLGPHVLGGAFAAGFESLGHQMVTGLTSNHTTGWLKWTWSREAAGIQLEYRQSDVDRGGVETGASPARRDWVVRARQGVGPVVAEAYAGASSVEDGLGDVVLREGSPQGGLRVRTTLPTPFPVEAIAGLRVRGHPRMPAQEIEVGGWAEPTPWLGVGLDAVHGRWSEGPSTRHLAGRARAGPFLGLTAFASAASATDILATATVDPAVDGTEPAVGLDLERTGLRLGLEFQRGGIRLGAAAVRATADSVPGFGLAFDPTAPRFGGGEVSGVEVIVGLPTGLAPFRVEGWLVSLDVPTPWLYTPAEHWRAALVYHHLPLPSGNLELYGRAEHVVRGSMIVPGDVEPVRVGAYRASNIELTIRIVTVRAFMRWQNVLNRPFQQDVPGFLRPGQHIVYGVKWEFWN